MRMGRVGSIVLAAMMVAGLGATSATATTTQSATEATTTTTTTAAPTTTTTTTTTTTSTTTTAAPTTTAPPPPVAEFPTTQSGDIDIVILPERGQAEQVADTMPPPTTTTTTTTLPPDALPPGTGEGRRMVYSKSAQRVWAVEEDGTVAKTHLVSGRLTWNQPLPGTYSVFSRSQYTCNINSPYICWQYMVRFTKGPGGDNIGFHEIPTDTRTGAKLQSISQLGTPLSAGCVRQAPDDAVWVWNWAWLGTKVVVIQ